MNIRFNKPFIQGNELKYIEQTFKNLKISGDGGFTKKCHQYFQNRYGFRKVLLTNSGTDALEMAALLLNIVPGDEIIMPSFTFVSTANAFELRGAKIKFVDIQQVIPNIDPDKIREAITEKTKAIVIVHYAGIACNMDEIMDIAKKYHLFVVEDAAQAIDAYYNNQPLGSIGDIGILSFHESKNIVSGEGGLCIINNEKFIERGEILWEKGTNRQAFNRGQVNKYSWVDVGSSFLPSDMIAAFLLGQLENLSLIQEKRIQIWNKYYEALYPLDSQGHIRLPRLPDFATNNAHVFFFLLKDPQIRNELLKHLQKRGIKAIFHYIPLHSSPYYSHKAPDLNLPNTENISSNIVRLPLFCELSETEQHYIIDEIFNFFDV